MKKIAFLLLFSLFGFLLATELQFGKIEFVGNNFLSDSELLNIISIESGESFDMSAVQNSAGKISHYYQNKGYYNVIVLQPEIMTEKAPEVDVKFHILERGRLQVQNIIFKGNHYLDETDFPPNKNLFLNELPDYLAELIEYYNFAGFLFATAEISEVTLIENGVDVIINIEENNYCEFEKIRISGNKVSTSESIIKIADLRLDKNIQPQDLFAAEARLRSKEYIKDAAIIPLNSSEILIDITEDRMTLFSGIVGYDDSAEDKFSGFFKLDFLNLIGSDRSLHFFWQRLAADSEELELKYHESGLYRFPIEADLLLYRQQQDSTFIRSNFETEIYYKYSSGKYGLYFGLESIVPSGREDEFKIERRDYSKVGVSVQYDSFDYYSNPTKGLQGKIKLYNIRQDEEEVINRLAVESYFAKVKKLNKHIVLHSKIQINLLENKGLTSVDYWHLGGFQDLRGFMEDSFYGYYTGCANFELRYLIARSSRLFLFSDYGYAKNSIYTKNKLFSVGVGMRLQTNLGVFGVDYGIGYSEGNWRSPMEGIIHFGLEAKL